MAGHVDCVRRRSSEWEFHAPHDVLADLELGEHRDRVLPLAALFVFRRALATVFVPKLSQVYRDLKWDAVLYPVRFGFLWGIAQTTFGLSISAVGMAIAFAIVCGLVCVTGSLVSILAFDPADLFQPLGLMMLLSLPVLLLGLVF